MKKLRLMIYSILLMALMPIMVSAGSISFNDPTPTSDTTYKFVVTTEGLSLNYISGHLNIINGTITNITMSDGWKNASGNSTNFYFYHNGDAKNTTIATVEVKMTGNSVYSVENLNHELLKCKKDSYGNNFDYNGNIVSASDYDYSCNRSTDSTLSSLSTTAGTFSPKFDRYIYYYNLTVKPEVNKIEFNATPNNNKAKIINSTTCNLNDTINRCTIVVESEVGSRSTYTIMVNRVNNVIPSPVINDFKVINGTLDKTFSPNVKTYNVTPNENAPYIYFKFNLNGTDYTSNKCTVADTANCRLTVTINEESSVYTFNIINNKKEEEKVEENKPSSTPDKKPSTNTNPVVKPNNKPNKNNNTNNTNNNSNNSSNKKDEETKNPIDYENDKDKNENKPNEDNKETENQETSTNNENITQNYIRNFVIIGIVGVILGMLLGRTITRHKMLK